MSLTIIKESRNKQRDHTEALSLGTWFIGFDQQIYLIALDDRTHEPRIICWGSNFLPFIVNVPTSVIDVDRILQVGTLLEISKVIQSGELNNE